MNPPFVLSIEDTVEEVMDSGFFGTSPVQFCSVFSIYALFNPDDTFDWTSLSKSEGHDCSVDGYASACCKRAGNVLLFQG